MPSTDGMVNDGDGVTVGNGGDSMAGKVAGEPPRADAHARGRGEPAGGAGNGSIL